MNSTAGQLKWTEEELWREHDYAKPQVEEGHRLHGGFDADGTYLPPRSYCRYPAIEAWTGALTGRGGELFAADSSLLSGPRCPNFAQHRMLLLAGHERTFWNQLTTTGKIEAKGRLLAEMSFPDLQEVVVEDISTMAIGHLNRGLLTIHGIDEGGYPEEGIGGHDVMWFVARDMVFGAGAFADVDPPETISRPEAGERLMPEIAQPFEGLLSLLMNLLLIEFRAEIGFAQSQRLFRDTELFSGCRAEADRAAGIIERIRTDELIHVLSLRLYLGELRELHLRREGGGTIAGRDLIDRFWAGLVRWGTLEQPVLAARVAHCATLERIVDLPQFERLRDDFVAAGDLPADEVAA